MDKQKPDKLDILELQEMTIPELSKLAGNLGINGYSSLRKQALIFSILQAQTERSGLIFAQGVPPLGHLQLPARAGRHLRLPFPDQALQPPHGRHRFGSDTPTERRREVLRPHPGRGRQSDRPREGQAEDHLRQSDPPAPDRADQTGAQPRGAVDTHHEPADPNRYGPAWDDRRATLHREDHAAPEDRQRDHGE